MEKHLISPKVIKFLAGGGVAAAINLILMAYLINHRGFDTPLLRNIANVLAIEAGIIISFLIYRTWVWRGEKKSLKQIIFHQFPLYHLAGGSALLARTLIIFPLLDWLTINYIINTFIGMIIGTVINYHISDRIVFKPQSNYKNSMR
ncbi:MAG: GtrA family protein [Microcystaceae cyanobacterium]